MMVKAWFTFYGETEEKNRRVYLLELSDKWMVKVEDMPALNQRFDTYERAEEAFLGFREMAFKDWGASEIHWG